MHNINTVKDKHLLTLNEIHIKACKTLGVSYEDLYLVGGCIASILQDEKYKDIDVILKRDIDVSKLDAEVRYLPNHFSIISDDGDEIQILKHRSFSSTSDVPGVLKYLDFRHCAISYGVNGLKPFYKNTIRCILKKELKVSNPVSAIASVRRAFKFCQRGYKFLPTDQNELLLCLSKNDLEMAPDTDYLNTEDALYSSM